MFKLLKISLITLALMVGVLFLGRVLLTTDIVHQFVKNKVESIANESINGTLSIGDLDGDLWDEILLTNIHIHQEEEEIFNADTLYANYDIWSFLREVYVINRVKLVGVQLAIEEQSDSVFNVQELIKDSNSETLEPESSLAVRVNDIQLRNINSDVYSPSYLPDSTLKINQLNAHASFSQIEKLSLSLSMLSFLVEEGRLPAPIQVQTAGSLVGEEVNLQKLVVETGRSLLKAQGSSNLEDSTLNGELTTNPFSLADIQPYLDVELPEEELQINLIVSGSLSDLEIGMKLNHPSISDLDLVAGLSITDEPKITRFGIKGSGLDIASLTNDSLDVTIGNYQVSFTGVLVPEIEESDIIWGFTFLDIRTQGYYLNRIFGRGTLKNDKLVAQFQANPQREENLTGNADVVGVTTENPKWSLNFWVNNLDASYWANNPNIPTKLHFGFSGKGKGFALSQESWSYSLKSHNNVKNINSDLEKSKNRVLDQSFGSYAIKGVISKDNITGKGHVSIDNSRLNFDIAAEDIFEGVAQYTYFLETEEFNASEITQLADFPTSINARIFGEGRGINPEECLIFATLKVDSSYINGAAFDQLDASVTFTDGVLKISDGVLNSAILEGEFSGRKNVTDETDPENWLTVDMNVKNLQPLAPLANAEILNAKGSIKGRITQDDNQVLRGDMDVDFESIVFDTLFSASQVKGEFDLEMKELRSFDLNLSIADPIISKITFQDINLVSKGTVNKDTLEAQFDLSIVGSERGKLQQEGLLTVNIPDEKVDVFFSRFDFISTASQLNLQRPFHVVLEGESISTDTLDLKSNGDAFLKLAIPYADSVEQYAWVEGKNFDFGLLQDVIFGERYVDGVLSGDLVFNQSVEDVTGNGQLNLTRVKYRDIEADSVALNFNIIEEQLSADASMSWDNERKVEGELNVPFVLLDRKELGDEFYGRPVDGSLRINPSELTRFKPLLDEFGISKTQGVLSFIGEMSGSAGEPNFSGQFVLDDPVLSGISLDTVLASFNYDNIKGGLKVISEIRAVGQRAARIEVEYPVAYDFRTFKVILPEEEEIIKVIARTENFNIAVFNDFLDEEYLKDLKGTLNADLRLEGTATKMIPAGYLTLSGAKVSVPIAGITLDDLKSDIEFTPRGLNVKGVSAKSGRGNFNANGLITLEGIVPKTVNINARANQFRLANTKDYNVVIDLNSKLSGNARTPKATGNLTVRNGFVFLQDFGENTIEEVQLEGEEISSFSPYDSLAIEMVFEIQRDFYVRNRTYLDMEIELVGKLDAQKQTNGELSLFGSLNGVKGYVRPLGKLFNMEEANFTFSGPIDNPDLSIKSKYTPPTRQKGESVVLYYLIEGTAQNPEFSFDSNPQMEQSDIVCYTLFSKPCYSLESWQNIFSSGETTSATDVLTDVLLDEVEAIATRQLGVDVVQIDNSGSSGGTSIKTGWYLNDRTFFAIVNEISGSTPKTLFVLEYILAENWDLIVTQGDDARRGIDFRYQYDY